MAFWAGLLNGKKTLLHSYLAMTIAGRACNGRRTRLCAAAMASAASVHRGYADFGFRSACCLLQRNFQVVAQVRAAINICMSSASPEEVTEYVAECVGKPLSTRSTHVGIYTGMSMLVVCSPLLRVRKYFVSFFGLLEVLLGFGIIRIPVRMMFHRKLAIGFFYILFAAVAVEAQHFIVIAFAHMDFLENWKRRGLFNACTLLLRINAKTQDAKESFSLRISALQLWYACLLLVFNFLKLCIHYFA